MKPNDKVVCVADYRQEKVTVETPNGWVKKGEVYCVTGTKIHPFFSGTKLGVFIAGKPRFSTLACRAGQEVPWDNERFRPVSEVGHPPIEIEQPTTSRVSRKIGVDAGRSNA